MNIVAREEFSRSQQPGPQMRVLVIDDDPIYRETSRMFLSMYGRLVTLAENGQTGIARAAEASFDVMIVDFEMPDMSGLEVIAAVRKMPQHRDLPIIMVTSRDDAMAIDRAFEIGAASFVVKPVNWTLLDHYVRFVRRAAENEIAARRAHADAEALSRTKDDLLAIVRHEMKTPLSAIVGFTKLAVEAQAKGDVSALGEHLEFVRQSGERLLTSLSDMAAYSDLISHRFEFHPERIAANWILGEAIDHRSRKAAERELALVCREECRDCFILADQPLLVSALVRLVDNALSHATDATRIEITLADTGDGMVRFSVSDDGAGMAPDRVAACLSPFTQDNMSLSRSSEGLGLGLPIATEVARLHGGSLSMRSDVGRGTTVEITIPKV